MDKEYIAEINARIRACLDMEKKLDYIDSLLSNKKISKLEHSLLKQNILKSKSEHEFKDEINSYLEKAVSLKKRIEMETHLNFAKVSLVAIIILFGFFMFVKEPAQTGFFVVDANNNTISANVSFSNETIGNNTEVTAFVTLKKTPIHGIEFHGVDKGTLSKLRVDDTPNSIARLNKDTDWKQVYAVDPTQVNFTNATLTAIAVGNQLYKCREWDFDNRICNGTWEFFEKIIPGQEYNFTLTQDDPAFAEIIAAIDAQHLDENYTFISDIYPEIEAIDNNWSDPIYQNEFVRVTYEMNLTNDNVIDFVARSNTSAYFDVYVAGTDQKVGTSDIVSGSQQYVSISGLDQPEDTFDFKIQDPNESDANPFIQFDYIHDAPNNLTANNGTFFDGFETGLFSSNAWTISSGWEVNKTDPYAGTYEARDNSSGTTIAYLYLNMSTAYYQNINISFYANTTGVVSFFGANWWNGTAWGLLMNTTNIPNYTNYNYLLTAGNSSNNPSFRLAFNCTPSTTVGRGCYLDNVNISGTAMVPGISGVVNYSITNQSVMINWTTSLNSNTTLLYGNQSSNLLRFNISVNDNGLVHNVSVSGLVNNTIYFYNVTSCTPAGACNTSGIYNFTTLPTPISVLSIFLNSTLGTNYTDENLTVYFNVGGSTIDNVTDWRINNQSMDFLNLAMTYLPTSGSNATDYSTFNDTASVSGAVSLKSGLGGQPCVYNFTSAGTISVPDKNYLNLTGNVSIEVVVAPTASVATTIMQKATSAGTLGWIIAFDGSLRPYFTMNASSVASTFLYKANSSTAISLNNWSDVFVNIFDGNRMELYVNGVLVNTSTISWVNISSGNPILIGMGFIGQMDFVGIYNRTFTPQQILMFNASNRNVIIANNTRPGENWTVAVTPENGVNGVTNISNQVLMLNHIQIISYAPNATTGQTQNTTPGVNTVFINASYNSSGSMTFNVTATESSYEPLTFTWFVNQISTFVQTLTSAFTSSFTEAISSLIGLSNVTAVVNGSNPANNQTFTFQVLTCTVPTNGLNLTGNITLCPGTYYLNTSMIYNTSNVNINCYNTIINGAGFTYLSSSNSNNITIIGCTIENASTAMQFYSVNSSYILQNNFINDSTGIYFGGGGTANPSFNDNILNNTFSSNSVDCLNIVYPTINLTVANNTFFSCNTSIYVAANQTTITSNKITNSFSQGIGIDIHPPAVYTIISNNVINNVSVEGFDLEAGLGGYPGNIITQNTIANGSEYGVYFSGGSGEIPLFNNTIVSNMQDGIYTSAGAVVNATFNTIASNSPYGIELVGGTTAIIFNNIMYNQTGGIALDGGATGSSIGNNSLFNNTYGIIFLAGTTGNVIFNNFWSNNTLDSYVKINGGNNDYLNLSERNNTLSFHGPINFTSIQNIYLNDSIASLNSSAENPLNITSTNFLTLNSKDFSCQNYSIKMLNNFTKNVTLARLQNYTTCEGTSCFNPACSGNPNNIFVTFKVTHWSTYFITNNTPPNITSVFINSTFGTNLTTENLTVYYNLSDPDMDPIVNITDWRLNNISIAVLNMPFEGGSTSNWTRDYSTYGNNGTVVNATWCSSCGYNGQGAYQFDGAISYINMSNKGVFDGASRMSVSWWAKYPAPNTDYPVFIDKYPTSYYAQLLGPTYGAEEGFVFFRWTNAVSYDTLSTYAPSYNTWHYFVAVYNNGDATLYIDGINNTETIGASGSLPSGTDNLYIGSIGLGNYFNGTIDNVQIYNRALSPQEILNINDSQSYIMSNKELNASDNWTACVTPNDDKVDGPTLCSNKILILDAPYISAIYPNSSMQTQNIPYTTTSISIAENVSVANLTFNATGNYIDYSISGPLTFSWFVNQVLALVQTLTSGLTSMFSQLFAATGQYNITVVVNNSYTNNSFTFNLNVTDVNPIVNSVFINSSKRTNTTFENITAYYNETDLAKLPVQNITDWRNNGTSIAILNMPFEVGSNSTWTEDYSTYGNNGTVNNAIWNSTGGYNGFGAYYFDGSGNAADVDEYINVSNLVMGSVNTRTFWFYPQSTDPTSDQYMLDFGGNNYWVSLYGGNTGDTQLNVVGGAGSITYIYGQTPINKTQWYFVAVTTNSNNILTIYVNGNYDSSGMITSGTPGMLDIGRYGGPGYGYGFNGSISDVQIYNRALSPQEIYNLYNNKPYILANTELSPGDNWTACVTPDDGTLEGNTVCSNNIYINNIQLISFYPNKTGQTQNISYMQTNSSSVEPATSANATFVMTANTNQPALTFSWFVNQVLTFVQTLTSSFISTFFNLFSTPGLYNVTVVVNASNPATNQTFRFFVNATNYQPPYANSTLLNSTYGFNTTLENLLFSWNSTSPIGYSLANIIDWRISGNSTMALNMPFEGGSNSTWTRDYSTWGNNGTLNNLVWSATGGYDGYGGYSFSGGYINVSNSQSLNLTDNFTLSAWIYLNDLNTYYFIMAKDSPGSSAGNFEFFPNPSTGALQLYYQNGTNSADYSIYSSPTSMTSNSWNYAVVTIGSGLVSFYLNGLPAGSFAQQGGAPVPNTYPLLIGTRYDFYDYLNGQIDNVQIYRQALSPQEILNIYNNQSYVIDSSMLQVGQNWTACITPTDEIRDGATVCSNNVVIKSGLPVANNITLNSTFGTNYTDENLTVYYNSSSPLNRNITNITDWRMNGNSIALLNMPFEGGSNSTWTRDYSTWGNNGTGYNTIWNATGGYNGYGAYMFNGINAYMLIPSVVGIVNGFTISTWIKENQVAAITNEVVFEDDDVLFRCNIEAPGICDASTLENGGYNPSGPLATTSPISTNWVMLTFVYNNLNISWYVNGVYNTSRYDSGNTLTGGQVPYAALGGGNGGYFNGSIDNLLVFNKSLSSQEILNLYNNQSYIMASQELQPNQNWTACITPNDGTTDGSTVCSNTVFTLNRIKYISFYPNATGQVQNISSGQINVSITGASSTVNNLTFNVTVSESSNEPLTFRWFINQVLTFVQTLASGFTSMFSQLFSKSGLYNVSVTVNGSNSANNVTFKFFVNATYLPPSISFVLLNSTYGYNTSFENLTTYWSVTPGTNAKVINITDWKLNGTSIAVLNMPFEGGSNSTWTRDYSTYGNNGTVINATWNSTGGYNGFGAYMFNGTGFINTTLTMNLNETINYTIMAWFYANNCNNTVSNYPRVLYHPELSIFMNSTCGIIAGYMNATTYTLMNINVTSAKRWNFVAVTRLRTATSVWNYTAYFMGKSVLSVNLSTMPAVANASFYIGANNTGNRFNGTIDNVLVLNQALSPQEILNIYNNQSYVIDSSMLSPGQNWTSCITPNDGTSDGTTVCSNNLYINNVQITNFYPNATGQLQSLTSGQVNVSIIESSSPFTNLVFNITAISGQPSLTFTWFVNQVSTFVQTLASGSTDMFSNLFSKSGLYNVTVVVNGSMPYNATFTFLLNATSFLPPNATSILLNSTYGTNTTAENLTVYWNSTDSNNVSIVNITDWRLNGTSIAVLNMPFEGGSTSTWTEDYSTYGNNGTVVNATWNMTGGYDGHGAYYFNNVNSSYITIPFSQSLNLTQPNITCMAWVYLPVSNFNAGLFFKGPLTGSQGEISFGFYTGSSNTLMVRINGGAQLTGSANLNTGQWYHVAFTYNNINISIFVNGALDNSIAANGPISITNNPFYLGIYHSPGWSFTGMIDNAQIYNRALSPQEILNIYHNQSYVMASQELMPGQNWTACITPNDMSQDGSTVCSNSVFTLNMLNYTSFYPNQSGLVQSTNGAINVSLNLNTSSTTNLTFNVTASESSSEPLTFTWFVNQVSKFVQTLTSGFTSMFSQLFSTSGLYNVSVTVNGSNSANNQTFSFYLNLTSQPPFIVNSVVLLNSTSGT